MIEDFYEMPGVNPLAPSVQKARVEERAKRISLKPGNGAG